jgi:hypothetical protein
MYAASRARSPLSPNNMLCVVSAGMPWSSFGKSMNYITLPSFSFSFSFALSILPSTTIQIASASCTSSFGHLIYSRHGFTVGSSTLGFFYTCNSFLHVCGQSTCTTANSVATAAPIACYATTRCRTKQSTKIYSGGLGSAEARNHKAV